MKTIYSYRHNELGEKKTCFIQTSSSNTDPFVYILQESEHIDIDIKNYRAGLDTRG